LAIARSKIIICCGSGGVKTTTSAAIALRAAEAGRGRGVTIDPARP
jgi:anion-transporting  ArsA/GET3 family ATPase